MTSAITIFSRAFIACFVSILLALAFHGLAEGVFGLHGLAAYAASALAALACGFGATFVLVGGATRNLLDIGDFLGRVSKGDFKGRLPEGNSSELVKLVEPIQTAVDQLKLTLGNWKGLTEAVLIPYAIVDLKGHLTFCNQMALDMLERSGRPEDHIGMFFSEFFYGDRTRKALIVDIMESNKGVVRDVEFKNLKGNTRFIQAALSPLHDLDGNVSGGMCMYLDYTQIRLKDEQIGRQHETMMNAVHMVEQIAGGLSQASQVLASQVDGASRGAQMQSRRTEETATAMEEMNATVLEVARNAGSAAERAGQAQTTAKEGEAVVERAVDAIRQVETLTATLKRSMDGLSERAEAIGRIMGVISDIADQTNLLALNAAIEAARAGDAGRGFAVVADEVRKLAEKTMHATKEVGDVTHAIQDGVRSSIGEADQAAQAVARATDLAGQSGRSLEKIVELVVATSDQVRSIAAAAEEQSAASDEIARAVEDVRRVSMETAQDMSGASGGVEALERLAGELQVAIRELNP
ncbi:MAG: Methyl-accepting chemotaxis sensory [Desulfovibrionaceae bacterium]|nr:MAG: Methyl-accepting chemotaxis sensory [Desulfovibrionaceae bacterium]